MARCRACVRLAAPGAGAGRATQRGFSLLEVLVAFVVLALVATALFELYGGALRNAGAAGEWSRAVLVAQSRLEEAASAQPLRPGAGGGTDEPGLDWQTRVEPYEPPQVDPELERQSESMPTRLYRVSVVVTFPGQRGQSREVTLSTVKLGVRNPP